MGPHNTQGSRIEPPLLNQAHCPPLKKTPGQQENSVYPPVLREDCDRLAATTEMFLQLDIWKLCDQLGKLYKALTTSSNPIDHLMALQTYREAIGAGINKLPSTQGTTQNIKQPHWTLGEVALEAAEAAVSAAPTNLDSTLSCVAATAGPAPSSDSESGSDSESESDTRSEVLKQKQVHQKRVGTMNLVRDKCPIITTNAATKPLTAGSVCPTQATEKPDRGCLPSLRIQQQHRDNK